MSAWKVALGTLCGVGILKEVNILRGFEDGYLTSAPYNLTQDQLEFEVHPVFVYSYVCALLVVLLMADILAYKPVIVVGILCLATSTALTTWGHSVLIAQMTMFSSGLGSATDLAFFSYAFAVAEPEHFQKASGLPRAALLLGRLLGRGAGEVAVLTLDVDHNVLIYVTLGLLAAALLTSLLLPSATLSALQRVIERELRSPEHGRFQSQVSIQGSTCSIQTDPGQTTHHMKMPRRVDALGSSLESVHTPPTGPMFYDIDTSSLGFSYNDMLTDASDMSSVDGASMESTQQSQQTHLKEQESLKEKIVLSISCAIKTITNKTVITWTVFWIVSAVVNTLMGTSITSLLNAKYPHRNVVMVDNVLEPVSLFAGAVLVLVISFVRVTWANFETLLLGGTSLVLCLLVGLMSAMDSLWLTCSLYVACRVIYQMAVTIAMYRVAVFVNARMFATVFGVSMLGSAILVVIFTATTAADMNIGFSLVAQLAVYSGLLGVCGLCLLVRSLYLCISQRFFQKPRATLDDLDTLIQS